MSNRLDKELTIRFNLPSRAKAQELIESGYVLCNGKKINKSHFVVTDQDVLEINDNKILKYVSRGGLKLEKALNEFAYSIKGCNMMDIGSSTGGFCDCALQNGVASIVAIDVGTNLMHETLKNNPKIKLYEQTHFLNLDSKFFQNIDFITCDVSFISLKKIISKIALEKIKVDLLFLIKPQFECGKQIADKYKGIILNQDIHYNIITDLIDYFNNLGFYLKNICSSPIKGGDGNIEYISYFSNKDISKNVNIDLKNIINNAFKKE